MRTIQKFYAIILALILMLILVVSAFAAVGGTGFSDVDANAWYLTMEVYPIGKETSDLSIFPDLPSWVDITFEVIG